MKSDPDIEVRIFTEATKVPRQERSAVLERLCGSDTELRRKVEKLLKAHDRLGDFMEEGPTGESID